MQGKQQWSPQDNLYYDLVSTLHHSLQAEQAYSTYIRDAQASGNKEAENLFQRLSQQSQQCSEQIRQVLASQIKH
jgi:selenocysteine lyase/cysteine desulfurase